jgi:predicted naringenin-chalcone synthase
LHLNFSGDTDAMLSASVFADGSAGALVSTREPKGRAMRLDQFQTRLTPQGEEDMAWTIGDHGFDMVLSSYVPEILQANLPEVLSDLSDNIRHWAIHPGGRAILDNRLDFLSHHAAGSVDLIDRQLLCIDQRCLGKRDRASQ